MKWDSYFYRVILARGRQYYHAGKVKDLAYEDGEWTASVKGSRTYRVAIELDEDDDIESMTCTCPFAEDGESCKHMAAVLMAIEKKQQSVRGQAAAQPATAKQAATKQAAAQNTGEQMSAKKPPAKKRAAEKEPEIDLAAPFAKMKAREADSYSYFDLNYMVHDLPVSERVWKKGKKLLAEQQVTLDNVSIGYLSEYYGGTLQGTARAAARHNGRTYGVTVSFDKDKIVTASCGCPGCYSNYDARYYRYGHSEVCAHEVALLYLLEDYLIENNPGDATDLKAISLMQKYQQRHVNAVMSSMEEDRQTLYIEPRLERDTSGLFASFRTGTQKLYVIKNLTKFVSQMENGEVAAFGTKTQIPLGQCRLEENSQRYFDFIRKAVVDERKRQERLYSRYSYGYSEEMIKGEIPLNGPWLDEFYDLIKETRTEYTYWTSEGKKKANIVCGEGMPKLQMGVRETIDERGIFQGIEVNGWIEPLLEGHEAYYFTEDETPALKKVQTDDIKELMPLYAMSGNGNLEFSVGRKNLSQFYYTILPVFKKYGTVVEDEMPFVRAYLPPEVFFRFYLDAEDENLTCRIGAVYGEKELSVMPLLAEEGPGHVEDFRDMNRESEAIFRVTRYFPEQDAAEDLFHCGRDEDRVYQVLNQGLEDLMAFGEVHRTDRFKRLNIRNTPKITVGVAVESDLMNLNIMSDGLSRDELLAALDSYKRKKKYFRLKNGDFVNIEDDSIEVLGQLMEAMHVTPKEFVKGKMQLPAYRALYLDKMLEQSSGIYSKRDSHFRKLVKEFKTVNDSDYEVPETLQDVMRNYQITGYKWLRTLDQYGFGGILADDMGLGKTLQMISVLLAWKAEGRRGTSLIVSPASLVYNWQEEFNRFAPQLGVCTVTGTQKERTDKLQRYQDWDVLVTSYDLLKRDIASYDNCSFLCQVLDEAQFIKNHTTAAAKAVKLIHSKTRYALTGTPIENRLSELWSIFDYLMPGFLYRYDNFKKELETPIVKNKDEAASARLKKMVSPFILRRLKKDVLKDLPDKLEKVYYAPMEAKQRKLYDGQVTHMQALLQKEGDADFRKDKLKILAELTRIRQICCDPSLIYENYDGGSAKREACMELMAQAMEGEHRMLVFSQFTTMLELLENDLKEKRIPYYKITGETPKEKRLELVHDFNEGDVPVFLISLKAGGTGLNLTGADVVIHYDPWWNLAVQNQATDRAHRIGQSHIVTVYKLIVKDSIEEKILKMQEVKKDLAEEILSGENGGLSALSKDELMELLAI